MAPSWRQHERDRGWAWVVLAASMGSNLLVGALTYFVGVVHTRLLDMFQPDTVTFLAVTSALNSALSTLTAPLASYTISRFGCRICCVLGGVFCFVGYASSAFVTSMYQIFFTYGITAGFGLGFVFAATNITIGFYFDRLRGVAAGIANSFQAVGILTGPIVYQAIVDAYNTRGAFLLLGAISLHFSFFGMFFRPTIYEGKDTTLVVTELDKELVHMGIKDPGTFLISSEQGLKEDKTVPNTDVDSKIPMLKHNGSGKDITETHRIVTSSLTGETADAITDDETVVNDVVGPTIQTAKESPFLWKVDDRNTTAAVTDVVPLKDFTSDKLNDYPFYNCNAQLLERGDENESRNDDTHVVHVIHDVDSLELNSVPSVPHGIYRCVSSCTVEETSHDHICEEDSRNAVLSSCPHGTSFVNPGSEPSHPDGKSGMTLLRRFRSSPYVQILDKAFLLHCVALFVSNVHISGVILHLPEYAELQGTGPIQRAELFLGMGAFSLLSKLTSGLAISDPGIDSMILNMGIMGLNGVITCFFPLFADTFFKQMAFSSLFGLYLGGVYALMTPLLVRLVGVERLAHAYGIIMFFVGAGLIVGPAVAAIIVDAGGTYSHSFVVMGLMSLCGCFFDMGAACFLRSWNRAVEISQDTDTNARGESDISLSTLR